jgi:hypothetical protein
MANKLYAVMDNLYRMLYDEGAIGPGGETVHAEGIHVIGGTSASTIADGADVTLGAIADAAVTTNTTGTVSGKLRGIVAHLVTLLSRWPASLGSLTKAGSVSVTLASDQGDLPVAISDGDDAAQGTTTDAATGSGANTTVIGALRAIRDKLLGSLAVTGTFWQATQPVSQTNAEILMAPNATEVDQRLTVDATAGGVQLAAFHANTLYVFWSCEDAQCRVTFDNSAPTPTNGHIINVGDSGVWSKALATAAKWIRTGGTSAVIHASQLK